MFSSLLGWNNSWDRKVSEEFILKDTAVNRELQLRLAEKSSLQLGAYLYRKEQRKKRMKLNERKLLLEGSDDGKTVDQNEQEYNSSATESHDDDRVFLHVGEILKSHLEYDYKMICKEELTSKIPSDRSVVSILENFVKCYALRAVTTANPKQELPRRRNSIISLTRKEQQHQSKTTSAIDYDEIMNDINLCKETADGIRIYFNFIIKDFLLYPEEREKFLEIMSEENLKQVSINETVEQYRLEDFFQKASTRLEENYAGELLDMTANKLKVEDDERNEKENLSSMASTSSCDSITPQEILRKGFYSKSWFPLNSTSMLSETQKILENIFEWEMIPKNYQNEKGLEPAMLFGIYHLIRLIIKLPEFLTSSLINEQKMPVLLKFLDDFVEFLEENVELYGPQNYIKKEII